MRGRQGRRKAAPALRYLIRAATLMLGAVRVRATGAGGGSREVAAAAAGRDAPRGLARVFASPPVSGGALRPLRLPCGTSGHGGGGTSAPCPCDRALLAQEKNDV